MTIDPHIFRAYDIRGEFGSQITPEVYRQIGFAFGRIVANRYGIVAPSIVVGRDARTHGPELEDAVVEGLVDAGCKVLRIGQSPSPVNYFAICTRNLDGGIQVTASHNPQSDNGLKLQTRNAVAFCGEDLQKLREDIGSLSLRERVGEKGSVEDIDILTPYTEHLVKMFAPLDLRIALDTGNGVAGPLYKDILERCGCAVEGLFIEPDGTFPNHIADPAKWDTLKNMQERVRVLARTGNPADIGLAFDGDGDRLGVVDETGAIRTADEVLLLLAQDHLKRHPGGKVVFTVSNSGMLDSEISAWGGVPLMCKVGHSFVEHVMAEEGALLGGEQSGHFFCAEDYFNYDDALVAALRVLKILQGIKGLFPLPPGEGKGEGVNAGGHPTLSKLLSAFPKVYQPQELRPRCPDGNKARIVQEITAHFAKHFPVNTLDGARVDFGDEAWAGIRQSNTSPCLSICFEARSPEKLREVEKIVLEHLKRYPEVTL